MKGLDISKVCLNEIFDQDFLLNTYMRSLGLRKMTCMPNLAELLKTYNLKFKRSRRIAPFLFTIGETYSESIPYNENNYYHVAWNISSANNLIKKLSIPVLRFNLSSLSKLIDPTIINEPHLKESIDNVNPVILVYYPPSKARSSLIIIDGNHRVVSKARAGQKEISGFLLFPEHHLKAMVGEYHRTLYKIHYNYYQIACFLGGLITRHQLERAIYRI